jgi:hypothetical protein
MTKGLITLLILASLLLGVGLLGSFQSTLEPPTADEDETTLELPLPSEEELFQARLTARLALEAQRRETLGPFYVPLPHLDAPVRAEAVVANALYVTANTAGMDVVWQDVELYVSYIEALKEKRTFEGGALERVNRMERILALVIATEVNALVIDVKDDRGLIGYRSDIEFVQTHGSNYNTPMRNFDALMAQLKALDVYCIARVVVFKDPYTAEKEPDHAIQLKTGGVYRDRSGTAWVNPFDPFMWSYVVAVAQEAALRGFDEIQFDYIRFPDNARVYNPITHFPHRNERRKDEAIRDFLAYARRELEPYNVVVSADVFGVITYSWNDQPEDIGQTWRYMAAEVDVMSPMIYPSHYGPNVYGFAVPDQHPYAVIKRATQEALERNAAMINPPQIRSWFQAFSAPWIKGSIAYTPEVIAQQMVANHELGVKGYLLWNAGNLYDPRIFFYHDQLKTPLEVGTLDVLERSPEMALERYLKADQAQRLSQLYLLTPVEIHRGNFEAFEEIHRALNRTLERFTILAITALGENRYEAIVSADVRWGDERERFDALRYEIFLEARVFKIHEPKEVRR